MHFAQHNLYDRIRRLWLLNDQPVALEEIWLDARYAREALTEKSFV
jgi:DNA-binding GntR family transcriptional regulator